MLRMYKKFMKELNSEPDLTVVPICSNLHVCQNLSFLLCTRELVQEYVQVELQTSIDTTLTVLTNLASELQCL